MSRGPLTYRPLRGVLLLAAGRGPEGMAQFEPTVRAFWISLVPLFALPVLRAATALLRGQVDVAATVLLLMVVSDLGPVVVSHWFAVRWEREPHWLRYATALNWCQGALVLVGFMTLGLFAGAGLGQGALGVGILGLLAYALWLSWVVTRAGLSLGGGRAVLLMLGVAGAVGVLIAVPVVADLWVNGIPPELAAAMDGASVGPGAAGPGAAGPGANGLGANGPGANESGPNRSGL